MAKTHIVHRSDSVDGGYQPLGEVLRRPVAQLSSPQSSYRPLEDVLAEMRTPNGRAASLVIAESIPERVESTSNQKLVIDRGVYGMPIMVSVWGVTMMSLGALAFQLQNMEVASKWLFVGAMVTVGGIGQFSLACLMRYFRGSPPKDEHTPDASTACHHPPASQRDRI